MIAATQRGTLKLLVEKGPSRGTELRLERGQRVTIGRRAGVDLVLPGDEFVSPEHAEIHYRDDGPSLRNRSTNGTLLNGRPVDETPLHIDDRISIGLVHLVRVCAATPPSTSNQRVPHAAAASGSSAAPKRAAANRLGFRVPWWVAVYLIVIACAGAFFGYLKLHQSEEGLTEIRAKEIQYGAARQLPAAETERLLHLLDTASVHERRGDTRSAYEAYREVLAARQPVDPRSPAYRYAALRLSGLRLP